ncbi:MAG: D-serine ammonia-lyase [Eubacterium sp.]|nr:D-serine ammonia-lyase [Eubacterium sp.]
MEVKEYARQLAAADPAISDVIDRKETVWINDRLLPFELIDGISELVVSDEDIADAEARLARFAPYIRKCFPETEETEGLIESPLVCIWNMQQKLIADGADIPGMLMLKMDSHLAIAGSVKARGGIYEVLKHAETLAIEAGLLTTEDNYEKLASDEMKAFFGQYTVQVGSTGNLGLSIGIMSAFLGFKVKVHMSADAKQWKKDMLRSKGVEVIEYEDDYSKAVAEGRRNSDLDPKSHFVDDERSVDLFLGYAVAANRLAKQFQEMQIIIDDDHPLIVYVPAGVGGAPGGVAYGLKRLYGDQVHIFFTEPVQCPSLLVGFASQKFEEANVHDFGLTGMTHADGLACASPSGFVTRVDNNIVSGDFTTDDYRLYDYMRMLIETEDIRIEPSSCASFIGPVKLKEYEASRRYLEEHGLDDKKLACSIQVCWATGGKLVPEEIWQEYINTYLEK